MDPDDSWPFDQPQNCATLTTTHVVRAGEVITHVYHDADDHGWQFHASRPATSADAMVVALREIVDLDATVLEVADLPPGWMATRVAVGDPWKRSRNPSEEEDAT